MTWVVVLSSVVASAPGKVALTPICGGASAGNCAIGSERRASTPNSDTRMASTQAKIGRSMKYRDMGSLTLAPGFRLDRHSRAQQRPALDDHLVTGFQPAGH